MRLAIVLAALLTFASQAAFPQAGASKEKGKAQAPAKKGYVLKGKVLEYSQAGQTMTVDHETVPGYMDAMIMPYQVNDNAAFKLVKPGDNIQATVYDGDYTLYDIKVVPAPPDTKNKK